jgi:hypothetical protein
MFKKWQKGYYWDPDEKIGRYGWHYDWDHDPPSASNQTDIQPASSRSSSDIPLTPGQEVVRGIGVMFFLAFIASIALSYYVPAIPFPVSAVIVGAITVVILMIGFKKRAEWHERCLKESEQRKKEFEQWKKEHPESDVRGEEL